MSLRWLTQQLVRNDTIPASGRHLDRCNLDSIDGCTRVLPSAPPQLLLRVESSPIIQRYKVLQTPPPVEGSETGAKIVVTWILVLKGSLCGQVGAVLSFMVDSGALEVYEYLHLFQKLVIDVTTT